MRSGHEKKAEVQKKCTEKNIIPPRTTSCATYYFHQHEPHKTSRLKKIRLSYVLHGNSSFLKKLRGAVAVAQAFLTLMHLVNLMVFVGKQLGVTFGPLSHVKTHYTGCLIGILVVVYEIIPT